MNGKIDPIWLAEFEQLEHLQERWRGAQLKRKRLSDQLERPLRWRKQLLLLSHLRRELAYIEWQLNLVMQYIKDVDSDTQATEASNEVITFTNYRFMGTSGL